MGCWTPINWWFGFRTHPPSICVVIDFSHLILDWRFDLGWDRNRDGLNRSIRSGFGRSFWPWILADGYVLWTITVFMMGRVSHNHKWSIFHSYFVEPNTNTHRFFCAPILCRALFLARYVHNFIRWHPPHFSRWINSFVSTFFSWPLCILGS